MTSPGTVTTTAPGAGTQDGNSSPVGLHVPVQPAVFATEPVWSVNGTDLEPGLSADLFPAGDFDGDGRTDLIVGSAVTDEVYVYYGEGDAVSLVPQVLALADGETRSFWPTPLGDVNGDGDVDILLGNDGANQLLLNNGSGGFTLSTTFPGGSASTYAVAFGDVDGDGGDRREVSSPAIRGKHCMNCGAGSQAQLNRMVAMGQVEVLATNRWAPCPR